ncbi:UDP-N-acetylglucosamine 2-epimerase (non-hydrolyzing) [Georgenia sp. M64]|uniref:non-hydrolyzing UDP-N-acetylglucosamine 2-epimerase n=1 Tax=Georgenia sp. M64 TaxID=3120520 RepID=UPI0030DFDB28
MKILSVVGARPQFVKLAPICLEAARRGLDHIIVHTGQHYDPKLSEVFFRDLEIPAPDVHLGVGSGSHGKQTGAMLAALDDVLLEHRPDWTIVYGDTNSTLAAAIAASKMHLPVAHLEAGLRSFNRRMPEEHNRVLTDHAADLLLAPTQIAADHLSAEGLKHRTVVVGDVMTDVLLKVKEEVAVRSDAILARLGVERSAYYVATIHRAENTDHAERLRSIIAALGELDLPVLLFAHPRLLAKAREHSVDLTQGKLALHSAVAYPTLVAAVMASRGVVTDSGGLQKEAFLLRVPCTTVRTETEWIETVELRWNKLAKPGAALIAAAQRPRPSETDATPYGDGNAAVHVLDALETRLFEPI